jgi:hypothetical protein
VMFSDVLWCSIWAIANSRGDPFSFTVNVSNLGNFPTVLAEATLSKYVDQGHGSAKAAVFGAVAGPFISTGGGVTQVTNNWGPDGAPLRWLTNTKTVTFGLEVSQSETYAYMIGKIYIF